MGKVDRLHNKVESLLLCFGLSALYLPTHDPARRPGITTPPYKKRVLLYGHAACTGVESWFHS